MDLYSGRFPLDFVTLCLDMSTEELNDVAPSRPNETSVGMQLEPAGTLIPTPQTALELTPNEKTGETSHTPTSASSSSAAESFSAYAERTVEAMLSREGPSSNPKDLHDSAQFPDSVGPQLKCSSVSEKVMVNPQKETVKEQAGQKGKANQDSEEEQKNRDVIKPAWTGLGDPAEYFTCTSELEDLMGSQDLLSRGIKKGRSLSRFLRRVRRVPVTMNLLKYQRNVTQNLHKDLAECQ